MTLSIKEAEKFLNNKSTSFDDIDILTKAYGKAIPYKRTATIAGNYVLIKKYKGDPYFKNYTSTKEDNLNMTLSNDDVKNIVTDIASNNSSSKQSSSKNSNIERSSQRRINKMKNIIRSNKDIFDKFITLTFGSIDYKERLNYSINKYPPKDDNNPLPPFYFNINNVLKKLSGIKKIDKCDEEDIDRLGPENETLRKQIVDYLSQLKFKGTDTSKVDIANKVVKDKYKGESLEKFRFNEQVQFELQRQLDNLICSKDPYNTKDAKQLLANFTNKINRLLDKEFPTSDSFKYIWVLEFQENDKIHFHLLCNLPYIDQWKLQKKWGEGMVHVKKVEDINIKNNDVLMQEQEEKKKESKNKYENIISYLTKNIRKTSHKLNLNNEQVYSISEGLKKPITTINTIELDIIMKYLKDNNYKVSDRKVINATNEYGRSYIEETYEVTTDELYKARLEIRHKLLSDMVKLAKEKGLDEITENVFKQVLMDFDENLVKEYFPSTR